MRSDAACGPTDLDPRLRGDNGAVADLCALGQRRRFDAFDSALNDVQ